MPRGGGDRHEAGRGVDLAATGFRAVDIVEHGEIGGRGIVGELDPHGGERGIAGEADVRLACQGSEASWTEPSPIAMQGRAPGRKSPRANTAATSNGTAEARIFKRNMIRTRSPISPGTATAYGWQSVKKTRYRGVDGGEHVLVTSQPGTVVPAHAGDPSTPRPIVSIIGVSGILDRPV